MFAPFPSPSWLQLGTEFLFKMIHKSKSPAQGGGACSGPVLPPVRAAGGRDPQRSPCLNLPHCPSGDGGEAAQPPCSKADTEGLLLASKALQEAPCGQGLSQVSEVCVYRSMFLMPPLHAHSLSIPPRSPVLSSSPCVCLVRETKLCFCNKRCFCSGKFHSYCIFENDCGGSEVA